MSLQTFWPREHLGEMLVEFQQALADLVASPEACRQARTSPDQLRLRYDLTQREFDRLVAMVNHRGMALNCMLYRANRLAPFALNLPGLCRALGPNLGPLLTEYSALYPNTNVHFYLECDRFCDFIEAKLNGGWELEPQAIAILDEEHSKIKLHLAATYIQSGSSDTHRPALVAKT
jgi:hypothetical protein